VMTVHAAKGLEAKIVFVPDTCGVPSLQHEPVIFNLEPDEQRPPVLAWSPRRDGDCPAIAAVREAGREATMEEYRRLLYVALTRAEERLYISGFHGVRGPDDKCWAKMIAVAFAEDSNTIRLPAPWDENEVIFRRVTPGLAGAAASLSHGATVPEPDEPVPDWLFRAATATHAARGTFQPCLWRGDPRTPAISAGPSRRPTRNGGAGLSRSRHRAQCRRPEVHRPASPGRSRPARLGAIVCRGLTGRGGAHGRRDPAGRLRLANSG
jgi:hypothetical protein